MTPVPNPADDDAATEALIARLIAADLGENIDSLRIGGSVEDYEDPLSSYERGVIDGTISDIPSWGDPISGSSSSGPCAGTEIPEYTGEEWDDSVAWNDTPCDNEHDNGMERQGRCEDNKQSLPDTKWCIIAQPSMVPTHRLASSAPNLDTTNATPPATCSQRSSSDLLSQPFKPPAPSPKLPDTVFNQPVLGPQRDTPTSSRLESHRDPSPLNLDIASLPLHATVVHSQVKVSGRSRSEPSAPFDASKPVLPVKLTKEEAASQAKIWPKPTRCHPTYNPAGLVVPRLSAADRYAGLDIDYSSSKGKARARAFDRSNVDADDYDDDYESAEFNRLMRKFERNLCESAVSLDDWHDSQGDDPPLIYVPFPGLALGRDEQEIRRLEDLAVVEIHVGEEETLESILNDICSPSDQKARVRLEASVSRAVLSTTGTQASADTTSIEASSTLGTQGSTDSTSVGQSTSSDHGYGGRPSRGTEPPMRSLRQERRRAYYRDRKGWDPKKNDPELLFGVQVRGEDEVLKKMPKEGEEEEEREEEEEGEVSRGRKRKSKAKKRKSKGKGKEREEEAEMEGGEASEGRSIEREASPLKDAPADREQNTEGAGCP